MAKVKVDLYSETCKSDKGHVLVRGLLDETYQGGKFHGPLKVLVSGNGLHSFHNQQTTYNGQDCEYNKERHSGEPSGLLEKRWREWD